MPPKKTRAAPKKKAPAEVPVPPESATQEDEGTDQEDEGQLGTDDPNITPESSKSSQPTALEVEESIATFFEDRPYFYDLTHPSYKNKPLRLAELAEFASTLGPKWDGKCAVTNCNIIVIFQFVLHYIELLNVFLYPLQFIDNIANHKL